MQDETSVHDLNERVALIENMIAEGRRSTESWGWVFLLWGIAYYVAIAWASMGQSLSVWGHQYAEVGSARVGLAWPVTMILAVIVTLAIGLRKGKGKGKGHPGTSVVRAVVAVWTSAGISMLVLFPTFGITGRLDEHSFVAIVAAMLAIANCASGIIIKWRSQIACAVVWWITAIAACFGSIAQLTAVFLTAIFLCQIVFGVYCMVAEARVRKMRGTANA